ncbi:MFS transporter [Actinoplanes sp. NPDC051343]|uniref:MFS transporter n=1 Tax=Actinoplanes sp. NPDC051343 TaxID=3363906 RepID=UPI0037B3E84A
MLLYPVYALLFADAGLSTGAISSLFAIWSIVSFLAEVPSGALADRWSQRGLFAVGAGVTASGYALWILWPAYPGFALGFVLWGIGGACASGTLEALVYDHLGSPDYARVMGRAGTAGILAMLAATLLAAPVYAVGGYRLVGIASVATVTLGGLLALRLPPAVSGTPEAVPEPSEPLGDAGVVTDSGPSTYAATLREGLRASVRNRRVVWAVVIAALVPGFTALDEYLPLLSREKGAATTVVPLLYALTALAMAAGSAVAGRFPDLAPRRLAALLALAAALVAAGALTRSLLGMAAVSAAFGLLQFALILTETRLQEAITGRARTTVLSISGFLSEVFAVALYGLFALDAPLPALFALSALPLAATALATARHL